MYYAVVRKCKGCPIEIIAIAKDAAWADEISARLDTTERDEDLEVLWWSTDEVEECPFWKA